MSVELLCILDAAQELLGKDIRSSLEPSESAELNRVFLERDASQVEELDLSDTLQYDELLERCREVSIDRLGRNSVIGDRYRVARDSLIGSKLFTTSTNHVNTVLKSQTWRKFHSIVGNSVFSFILLNYDGFFVTPTGTVQLFGRKLNNSNYGKWSSSDSVSLKAALYVNAANARNLNPISPEKKPIFEFIFGNNGENVFNYKKVRSRYKAFSTILSKIQSNHSNLQYFRVFDHICKEIRSENDENMVCSIDKRLVLKFCVLVFDAIFPVEAYGSKKNKQSILKNLGLLVTSQKGDTIKSTHLMKWICLKDIEWLGKGKTGNLSKQDHTKRYNTFKSFQVWLFNKFFTSLLGSFFHITHISSSKELLFYRHSTWMKISKEFLQKYASSDLREVSEYETTTGDGFYCRTKVMPKKNNQFRVINVPVKGRNIEGQKSHTVFIQKKVKPARHILTHKRMQIPSKYPKITSSRDIPTLIKHFKENLTGDLSSSPVYFLKFDVKDCFDNLPKDKIFNIVKSLLDDDEFYFVNYFEECDAAMSITRRRNHFNVNNISANVEGTARGKICTGGGTTYSLRGDEIMSIVSMQLDSAYTYFSGSNYTRQKGVFQGLHLSSVFCDLVYDQLIEEKFEEIDSTNSMILRIADDFLILSTDRQGLEVTYKQLELGFPEFGVRVNQTKTATNAVEGLGVKESVFTFCGFQIDIQNLKILKNFDSLHVLNTQSHKSLTQKLLWVYKTRLNFNTLDYKINDEEQILKQIFIIATKTMDSYIEGTIVVDPQCINFADLVDQMASSAFAALQKKSPNLLSRFDILKTICFASLMALRRKNTRYSELINYLQERLYMTNLS